MNGRSKMPLEVAGSLRLSSQAEGFISYSLPYFRAFLVRSTSTYLSVFIIYYSVCVAPSFISRCFRSRRKVSLTFLFHYQPAVHPILYLVLAEPSLPRLLLDAISVTPFDSPGCLLWSSSWPPSTSPGWLSGHPPSPPGCRLPRLPSPPRLSSRPCVPGSPAFPLSLPSVASSLSLPMASPGGLPRVPFPQPPRTEAERRGRNSVWKVESNVIYVTKLPQ